jgi:hypothetical protein
MQDSRPAGGLRLYRQWDEPGRTLWIASKGFGLHFRDFSCRKGGLREAAGPAQGLDYVGTAGLTFWLLVKKFAGSYFAFTAATLS